MYNTFFEGRKLDAFWFYLFYGRHCNWLRELYWLHGLEKMFSCKNWKNWLIFKLWIGLNNAGDIIQFLCVLELLWLMSTCNIVLLIVWWLIEEQTIFRSLIIRINFFRGVGVHRILRGQTLEGWTKRIRLGCCIIIKFFRLHYGSDRSWRSLYRMRIEWCIILMIIYSFGLNLFLICIFSQIRDWV